MGAQLKPSKYANLHEEATRVQAEQIVAAYDSDEFNLGIVTNQSLKNRGGSALFVNAPVAHGALIRSDQTITVRLNANTNPAITIEAGIPFEIYRIEMTDIFVTTTAASNNLKVLLL